MSINQHPPQESQHEQLTAVQNRFGEVASAYVTSTIHASGPDLRWTVEEITPTGHEQVVDVATGAGHTALALAPYVAQVTAVDATAQMLEAAQQLAASRSVTNIRFLAGTANALPVTDEYADIVVCRYAAHHFPDLLQAAHEWNRVLKPGGKLVVVDTIVPEEPSLATFANTIEWLRDTSHVFDHPISEWLSILRAAGFAVEVRHTWDIPMDVPSWTRRMQTPRPSVDLIVQRLRSSLPHERKQFQIEAGAGDNISFTLPVAMFVGAK